MDNDNSSRMIIAFIIICCCLLSSSATGLAYYENWTCSLGFGNSCSSSPVPDTSGSSPGPSPSRGPGPSPSRGPAPPTDPRSSVWSKGQLIQSAPLEIIQGVTAPIMFATQPILPATVTYSVSMDMFITRQSAGYLEFLASNTGDSWEGPNGGHPALTSNHPLAFVVPAADAGHVGGIGVRHNDATTNWDPMEPATISNTVKAKYGQWFNFVFRINGSTKKVETYIDGVLAGSTNYTNTPTWDSVPGRWSYGTSWKYNQDAGSTKVANVYFFNTYLADADIPKLKIPSTPSPAIATTSYYEPEPYTKD